MCQHQRDTDNLGSFYLIQREARFHLVFKSWTLEGKISVRLTGHESHNTFSISAQLRDVQHFIDVGC